MRLKTVTKLSSIVLLIAIAGCVSGAPSSNSAGKFGIPDNCNRWLTSLSGTGANDPSEARVAISTVLTAGANLTAYGTCKQYGKLTPAAMSTINNGIYHSADGTISAALPAPLAQDGQLGIQVLEGDPSGVQKVYFVSTKAGGPVYGIYILRWSFSSAAPKSLSELEYNMFRARYYDSAGMVPNEELEYLYKENVTLADGAPAIFEVVRPRNSNDATADQGKSSTQSAMPYLIYYLIKLNNRSDAYAVLSIFWRSACPKCVTGPEAGIRGMDPGIIKFVDSFKVNLPGAGAATGSR